MLEEFSFEFVTCYFYVHFTNRQECFEYFKSHHQLYDSSTRYIMKYDDSGCYEEYRIYKII